MLLKAVILNLVLLSFSSLAHASLDLEACDLSSISLDQETTIKCEGTFNVEPGTVIETNGYELKLVGEAADFNGLTVYDQGNGLVKVFLTLTASGELNVVNVEGEIGSDFELVAGSTSESFSCNVDVGLGGYVLAEASGQTLPQCQTETTVALH